jgi:hypothetical protein
MGSYHFVPKYSRSRRLLNLCLETRLPADETGAQNSSDANRAMVRPGCTGCQWRAWWRAPRRAPRPPPAPRLLQQLHSLASPQNLVQWQSRHRFALAAPAPLSLHSVSSNPTEAAFCNRHSPGFCKERACALACAASKRAQVVESEHPHLQFYLSVPSLSSPVSLLG